MLSRDEFLRTLSKKGIDAAEVDHLLPSNFQRIAAAAEDARAHMPGVGFMSVSKRLNCFYAVCHHLDRMVEDGRIDLNDSQAVILLLKVADKTFEKAVTMFDLRGSRASTRERAEMPRSARMYLAGMEVQT